MNTDTYSLFLSGLRNDEKHMVVQMIRSFSTWEPFDQVLRKQLNVIGLFLSTWLGAVKAIHYFENSQIKTLHWIPIGKDERSVHPRFEEEQQIYIHFPFRQIGEVTQDPNDSALYQLCENTLGKGYRYLLIPFDQYEIPLGRFLLAFDTYLPDKLMLGKIRGSLNILQNSLQALLYNQYPINSSTYLPSYLTPQRDEVAVLFCDIRNSTAMFEIARMTHAKYAAMVIALLKSFLEYTSRVISVPNIGRIHKFMGDGVMATFGEYLTLEPNKKAVTACVLGLLTSTLLVDGFNDLWHVVQDHTLTKEYLGTYNEDLELRLGVGLNYGQVSMESFGIVTERFDTSFMRRGFYEFTAVGDHVNFAQRLCSAANKPLSVCDIVYRSNHLDNSGLTSPIIISKTVAYWIQTASGLKRRANIDDPLSSYRSVFSAKGKGHPMPGFEVNPNDIDTNHLLSAISGIHENRFHSAMSLELTPSVSQRPLLKEVRNNFMNELNRINQNYSRKSD